jgi:small subunit ribosomal protein S6
LTSFYGAGILRISMNTYELTIILPGGTSSAKKKTVQERIEKIIKTGKGKVVKTEDWGKIDLAYEIKKETSAVFFFLDLELEPETAKNLKDKLRLDNDIMRYLLVKKD